VQERTQLNPNASEFRSRFTETPPPPPDGSTGFVCTSQQNDTDEFDTENDRPHINYHGTHIHIYVYIEKHVYTC